jgi:Fe-S cluster biogenesis protein NfuA
LRDRVAEALELIRPYLQRDGGDIELVDVDDGGVVQVRFKGACVGCPSAAITISQGVERTLKDRIPEVTKVCLV